MRTVYEAANAVEAHMLADLLKQQGIHAHVRGEALQGAIGELQASGLVRLEVSEEDHDAARAILKDWERSEPPAPAQPAVMRRPQRLPWLLLGLALGVAGSYVAQRAPVSQDGVDHDRDGLLDEHWTYSATGILLKVEVDRNADRKIDYVIRHDERGLPAVAESDEDFDGEFETEYRFRRGNVEWSQTDTDGNGHADLRTHSPHGVLESVEHLRPAASEPYRVDRYRLGRLMAVELDTDADGRLDTRLRYSPLGEVASRDRIVSTP